MRINNVMFCFVLIMGWASNILSGGCRRAHRLFYNSTLTTLVIVSHLLIKTQQMCLQIPRGTLWKSARLKLNWKRDRTPTCDAFGHMEHYYRPWWICVPCVTQFVNEFPNGSITSLSSVWTEWNSGKGWNVAAERKRHLYIHSQITILREATPSCRVVM